MTKPRFRIGSLGLKVIGGVKNLPKADLYIDARAFPDAPHLRVADIHHSVKASHMLDTAESAVEGVLHVVDEAIKHIATRRRDAADPFLEPFRIVTFCAYGINRSVSIKSLIDGHLRNRGFLVVTYNLNGPEVEAFSK